ncbi:hypothetical protein ZTR_06110 [Talaromyces verruculosus]|nr:hypothetical protein ZTR_06110 [Talaromyces verruculosus]
MRQGARSSRQYAHRKPKTAHGNFDQGQMKLFTSANPSDPTMKTFDVSNWVYAFGSDIDGCSPTIKRGGTGIYSIAALFMQLEENPTYYPKASNFQGEDWSRETAATQANLSTLLYAWMAQMVQNGQTNVGIALQTNQPQTVNAQAPTFPLKQIDHSAYPGSTL